MQLCGEESVYKPVSYPPMHQEPQLMPRNTHSFWAQS